MNQANPNADALKPAPMASLDRIGRIVAVTGAHAMILLDVDEQLPGHRVASRARKSAPCSRSTLTPSIALALVSAMSSPMPSHAPGRAGAAHRRGRVHRRTAQGRTGPADQLPARYFDLSFARRSRLPRQQERAVDGLCLRHRDLDPHRPHPAGRLDPGHGQDRRAAGQAFRRAWHHRHRQILCGGPDPEPHSGEKPASPYPAARRASRIRTCPSERQPR